eukprot:TRINITY_DN26704_c0_g1_i1.p1 TRINITY_DN26704_c0_g1~~TRINITY_DN26704_c0_g1_i1.p1  ORF type:complete len:256 (-),score=28.56 TRINITY_DN26704_c0_g1_i1:178-882(-)
MEAACKQVDVQGDSEGILILMRHSARLDDAFECFEQIPEAKWPDKLTRPYDPPICDFELPREAARAMSKYNVTSIVTSPFRRCLQTAGVVAGELGIRHVSVDNRLGEYLPMLRRCCVQAGLPEAQVDYLTEDQAKEALNLEGAVLAWDRSANVPKDPDDLTSRVGGAIPAIMASGGNVLIVTHGDLFNAYLPELFDGIGKFKADVAGWAAIRGPHGARVLEETAILETHRVETL